MFLVKRPLFSIIIFLSLFIALSSSVRAADPTPTPTIELLPVNNVACPNNGTIYPPNSKCYAPVNSFEVQEVNIGGTQSFTYPLSCIEAPDVVYQETYTGNSKPPQTRTVTVNTDISEAQLGFLGPDSDTLYSTNPDRLAQSYLFNALFDRPGADPNSPKESFRTFWRMLDNLSQAQLKAFYIENTNQFTYYYVGTDYKQHEVNIGDLRLKLPACLKTFSLSACWKGEQYVDDYLRLDKTTKEEYDALLPFDFNNMRSYIVLGSTVSKENIPYLNAILSGLKGIKSLLSSVPGLFDYYTPGWAIQQPTKQISDSTVIESLQYPSLILRASLSSCSAPKKTSSLTSPKTYPR